MKQIIFPCTIFKQTVTGDEKWIIYSNKKKKIFWHLMLFLFLEGKKKNKICTLYEEGTEWLNMSNFVLQNFILEISCPMVE